MTSNQTAPITRRVLCHAAAMLVSGISTAATAPRETYNFNPGWLLKATDVSGAEATSFADADWKQITLPHAWNEDSAFKVDSKKLPSGIAWYRKHFKLPAAVAGKKVFLEFEGIRQAGEFYLNGEFIGRSENGVMAFGFDISDKLKPAENVLAARIENSTRYAEKATGTTFQWNVNEFAANFGGIPKNVKLHVTDKLYQTLPLYSNLGTTGVYVYAQDFDIKGKSAKVTAEAQVRNEHAAPKNFSYEVTITGPDGKIVQTIQGGEQTLAAGETKIVSASAKVSDLQLLELGLRLSLRRGHDAQGRWQARRFRHDAHRFPQVGVRQGLGETQRPHHPDERLRPALHQRVAGGRPVGAAVAERFQQ